MNRRVRRKPIWASTPEKLRTEVSRVLAGKAKKGTVPPLWDGHAGVRIADMLVGQRSRVQAVNGIVTLTSKQFGACVVGVAG